MLFKEVHLQGIKSGTVHLAFRKWEKAAIKKGTLMKTAVGLVEIVEVTTIDENKITDNDAKNAGFLNRELLFKSLRQNDKANIYRIEVQYHSEDPRIELREQALTEERFIEIQDKLIRLDKFSKQGNWTEVILLTIKSNPHFHASGISKLTGYEKEWLKLNIRKLKNLGLTISHTVGYELSPLGSEFIEKLANEKNRS